MRLLRKTKQLRRLFGFRGRDFQHGQAQGLDASVLRTCGFEELEGRSLRAADLHLGAVYFEEASGDDSAGDRLEITFQGGAAGTELKSLTINGDKLLDGNLTLGDIFFDVTAGGQGSFKAVPLALVSHEGFTVTGVTVEDGSSLITFYFSGFDAGEKLVFTIDVDEQGLFSSTSVAEGGEFEGSRLIGTFVDPHYEDATLTAVFYDEYDDEFAQAATQAGSQLNLPRDSYMPPESVDREDRTAGAVATLRQTPKPITISGRVFNDPNLSNSQDAGELGIAGVSLTLLEWNGSQYVATGKTATTNALGDYGFDGILPGKYRVVETQPNGYLSVGSRPGTVNGTTVGVSTSPDVLSEITLLGGQDSVRNDFAEVVPGSISGRVYADPQGDCVFSPNDTPLAGVEVQLLDAQGVVLQTTHTNAQGQYEFEGLMPGTYAVKELQPAGYYQGDQHVGSAGGTVSGSDVISQIVLGSAVGAVDYDFCELLPASLSGRVFYDPDQDGQFGTDDLPLADVAVQLLDAEGVVIQTALTNSAGQYKFDDLAPGTYSVREVQPSGYLQGGQRIGSAGGMIAATDLFSQIVLGSNANAVNYDFWERLPGSISGRVHADPEADCLLGPNDMALSGVAVQLLDAQGNVLRTTFTSAAGEYRFHDLAPGTYAVREVQPSGFFHGDQHVGSAGGAVAGDDHIENIVIGSGNNAVDYNFCELIPASLSGRVFYDPEADGAFETADLPLANVALKLLDANGLVVQTTITNSVGEYKFEMLPPGAYSVREVQPSGYLQGGQNVGSAGGVIAGGDMISQIVLGSDIDAVNYDFWELLPGSISGRVHADPEGDCIIGPNDVPLTGVRIELLNASGTVVATTLTDAQGRYRFDGLVPGAYSVRELQPAGYTQGDQHVGSAGGVLVSDDFISQIVIGSGSNATDYNFCELPQGSISGYVFQDGPTLLVPPGTTIDPATVRNGIRDASDRPIPGVMLALGDATGEFILDASGQPRVAVTDANGYYQFTGLPAGVYTVRQVQPEGFIDFLDTPGTTGGFAVNRNGLLDPLMLGQLTVPHNFDAIIRIAVPAGAASVENNFSEIRIDESGFVPPIETPSLPPLRIGGAPFIAPPVRERFEPPPIAAYVPTEFIAGNSVVGYSWHLSVIDGGLPRGGRSGQMVASVSETRRGEFNVATWTGADMDQAQWTLISDRDEPAVMPLFGTPGAVPVSGDFNGDSRSEIGVFLDGEWFVDMNGNAQWDEEDLWALLGKEGDKPVVGDWNGDGKDDIGIFGRAWPGDPRAIAREPGLPHSFNAPKAVAKNLPPKENDAPLGKRMLKSTAQGPLRADLIDHVFNYGVAGDRPVAGDWTGNGIDCIAVFRDGDWHLDQDGDGCFTSADKRAAFGRKGDLPVVGDWDGDGMDELGVYRGGTWILDTNKNRRLDAEDQTVQLGGPDDKPVVGDWDGDGRDQVGLMHEGRIEHSARR